MGVFKKLFDLMKSMLSPLIGQHDTDDDFQKSAENSVYLVASIVVVLLVVYLIFGIMFRWFEGLGQFGDFLGGVLNPIIAFLALFALWKTNKKQVDMLNKQIQDERQRTQEQNDEAAKLRDRQTQRQVHDDFVRLFDAYARLVETFKLDFEKTKNNQTVTSYLQGKNLFNKLASISFDDALNPQYRNLTEISEYISATHTPQPVNSSEFKKTMSESRYTAQLEDEINKGIRYLYPYYRVVFNLLRTLSEEKKRNPFCHDMVHQDIKFFRAQLSEGELIWISLNLLYHSEGANLSKYVDEFGLLKHLQSQAVKDDLLEKYPELKLFGRKYPYPNN